MAGLNVYREGKIEITSAHYSIEFDRKYGERKYPFPCNFNNIRVTDDIIAEIESSKIIKVDIDFCYFSPLNESSRIYIVPQFGYTTEKITTVFFELLKKMSSEAEST